MPVRALLCLVAVALSAAACEIDKLPTAATPVASPAPPGVPPPLPTTVPGVLSVAMPIEAGDLANTAYGLAPFGYHGLDHAEDGHAGWDIEYRVGGVVRAAAAGTVASVGPDPAVGGRSIVHLEHLVGAHHYRTVYTNLATVSADIVAGAAVRSGQSLGLAGTLTHFIGRIPLMYAMTHFQLDDLEFHREGPDPKAVSPEPFLSPEGKSMFDRAWSTAAYPHELVEPLATNPRNLSFPASRTWTRAGGNGPAGIRFTRRTVRDVGYEYELLAESGTVVEAGTVSLSPTSRPHATLDLFSPTAQRLGVYDIVSGEMRLTLGEPGAARPASISSTTVYRTTP